MPRETGKVQVHSTTDGKYSWRKRDGSGDIVSRDDTRHPGLLTAIESAVDANPGIDRVEVLLDDDGQGGMDVPWSRLGHKK